MNNITPMFTNNSALTTIRNGGYGAADFDIGTAPLVYYADGTGFPSSKNVIYRTDTCEELGIHGQGYKAVAPKHMIDGTRNIIERSGLCTDNMQETIRTSHNGARTFVQYKLPEHTYKTSDGDSASLSLLSISSFDGTWPYMISAAATQFACTNLQVFVSGEVAVYKSKHTQSLDIELGGRVVTKCLQTFNTERELWQQWHGTECSDYAAFSFFATALKCTSALKLLAEGNSVPEYVMADMARRNTSLEYMWNVYSSVYSKRLGKNYWGVYNAMTDWSTHADASRPSSRVNIASINNDRQQVVREAVRYNNFMKAA